MNDVRQLTQIDAEIKIGASTFPVTLDVYGYMTDSFPATRSSPAEGGLHIERVMLDDTDVMSALPESLLDSIGHWIYEEMRS